jgi:Ni2+-binding GTPase involved in maturation of urease and hydrogenase
MKQYSYLHRQVTVYLINKTDLKCQVGKTLYKHMDQSQKRLVPSKELIKESFQRLNSSH